MESHSQKCLEDHEHIIQVDPLSHKPTCLFERLSETKTWKDNFKIVPPLPLESAPKKDHIRFVCISDTHTSHDHVSLPEGDVLLHAGDFTFEGLPAEFENFCKFLERIKGSYKHIIVIAGNHELSFDSASCGGIVPGFWSSKAEAEKKEILKGLLQKHCIYLEDEEVNILGFRIYGTPWQPWHRGWAFNVRRGERILEKWNKIPCGIDILVSHGPPLGHGDLTKNNIRAGCAELLSTIQKRVKPKVNVFGHIHEGYGITTDGTTLFINASICNMRYMPINRPIIFDLPIPSTLND